MVIWLILSILSGVFYRLGGMGVENKLIWLPKFLFNTKTRDFGCPIIFLLTFYLFTHKFNLLITFILMFGALTTYWDKLPINKGQDNFFHHGTGIGLSTLPLIFLGISIWNIMFYTIILSILMGLWSYFIDNVNFEEIGRGLLIVLLSKLIC